MTSFSQQLNGFGVKVERMERDVFHGITEEVHRSIVFGSEITAAPGSPVDIGTLRDSWTPMFVDENTWQDTTHLDYAPVIEDNVNGVTFRNHGPHSVKMTKSAFGRIVDVVTARIKNAG